MSLNKKDAIYEALRPLNGERRADRLASCPSNIRLLITAKSGLHSAFCNYTSSEVTCSEYTVLAHIPTSQVSLFPPYHRKSATGAT